MTITIADLQNILLITISTLGPLFFNKLYEKLPKIYFVSLLMILTQLLVVFIF